MRWLKMVALILLVPGLADIVLPGTLLLALHKSMARAFGLLQGFGVLLILTGVAVVVWVCQAFVRRGKGLPAPFDPPRRFVSEGLFRWVRNPIYLAAALLIPLGEALYFETYWLAVYSFILMLVIHLYVVRVEEPTLVKRFGRPYQKYLRTVPRWIPRRPQE